MQYTRWLIVLVFLALLQAGCASFTPITVHDLSHTPAQRVADLGALDLRDGQLVLTRSDTPLGMLMYLMSEDFSRTTHIGILAIEDGEPWVYEAWGTMDAFGGGRPTDRIRGPIRRTRLTAVLRPALYAEIHEPSEQVDRGALVAWARQHYEARTQYDPYYNLYDADTLYCSEFVARGLEHAGGPPVRVSGFRRNRSIDRVRTWLGVNADAAFVSDAMASEAGPTIVLSRFPTRLEADHRFVLGRELARRFDADQRYGNLVTVGAFGVDYTPAVNRFMEEGLVHLEQLGSADADAVDAAAQAFATSFFAPGGRVDEAVGASAPDADSGAVAAGAN